MQYEKAIVDADPAMRSYLAWIKETRNVELTPDEALAEVRARIDGAKQPKHDTLRLRMRRLALLLA